MVVTALAAGAGRRNALLDAIVSLSEELLERARSGEWDSLPEQETEERDVLVLPDRTPATAVVRYPQMEDFGAQISAGAGLDVYLIDNLALSMGLAAHVRVTDQERLPQTWAELLLGVRFGL